MHAPPGFDQNQLQALLETKGYTGFGKPIFELMGRYSTDIWQVKPSGNNQPTLVLKKPYRASRTGESADLEAKWYEQIAPRLPVSVPPYIGLINDTLVLENVPDLVAFDFRVGPQPVHADLAIDGFAHLHATTVTKTDIGWVPRLADQALRLSFQDDFDLGWRNNREKLHELCPTFSPIGDALVGNLASTLQPLASPGSLLHGDGHGENLPLTSAGNIVFLDWQSPRIGNPAFDLAIFLAMSYPIEKRRIVEQQLVRKHHQLTRDLGLNLPDPEKHYRLGLLRRAARIVEISSRDWFSSFNWVFKRCATAAVDHETLDLIV